MQELVWGVSMALIAGIACVFLFVVVRSHNGANFAPIQQGAGRARDVYFWTLAGVMLAATIVTLSSLPYPRSAPVRGEPQIVNAIAHQWYWDLSTEEVVAGRTVEFRVTSADVNHGFGLYGGSRLLAQTQAMPGYVNVLRYTFDRPGAYQVRCLEYCGIAHHAMDASIMVRAE